MSNQKIKDTGAGKINPLILWKDAQMTEKKLGVRDILLEKIKLRV
jgi:hypothetical protein